MASDPKFPIAFSHFLRQRPEAWRMRRGDQFRPLDANLVEHRVAIQGRISPELVSRFLESAAGKQLEIACEDRKVSAGEALTLYVPAIRQPKRILFEFSGSDERGVALSILSRFDGAKVAADYIKTLLSAGAPKTPSLALRASMFANPHDVLARLSTWAKKRPQESPDARLQNWVEREGEIFFRGCGPLLGSELNPLIADATGGHAISIPDWARVDAVRFFRTLTQLLLYGIRDVAKMLVDTEDAIPAVGNKLSGREELMADPSAFAKRLAEELRKDLEALQALIVAQTTTTAEDELFRNLSSWAAYVPLTIQLGIPFSMNFSQVESARTPPNWPPWRRGFEERVARFWKTSQEYPIAGALKDAGAVHIEITVPDQELRLGIPMWWHRFLRRASSILTGGNMLPRLGLWARSVITQRPRTLRKRGIPRSRIALLARLPDGDVRVAPLERFFSVIERPTERYLQIYSCRQLLEARHEDELYRYLHILVPLRLSLTTCYAYVFAALAFLGAALYVGVDFGRAIGSGKTPADLEPVVTVAALAVTLSLWLVAVQHPRPIINGKVQPARAAFFFSLLVIIGTPIVFLAAEIIRWLF